MLSIIGKQFLLLPLTFFNGAFKKGSIMTKCYSSVTKMVVYHQYKIKKRQKSSQCITSKVPLLAPYQNLLFLEWIQTNPFPPCGIAINCSNQLLCINWVFVFVLLYSKIHLVIWCHSFREAFSLSICRLSFLLLKTK